MPIGRHQLQTDVEACSCMAPSSKLVYDCSTPQSHSDSPPLCHCQTCRRGTADSAVPRLRGIVKLFNGIRSSRHQKFTARTRRALMSSSKTSNSCTAAPDAHATMRDGLQHARKPDQAHLYAFIDECNSLRGQRRQAEPLHPPITIYLQLAAQPAPLAARQRWRSQLNFVQQLLRQRPAVLQWPRGRKVFGRS